MASNVSLQELATSRIWSASRMPATAPFAIPHLPNPVAVQTCAVPGPRRPMNGSPSALS